MTLSTALVLCGVLAFLLVPLAPAIVRLRIRVLRFLRWNWFADLRENHFSGFVFAARIIMLAIGLTLLILGLWNSKA